MSVKKCNVFLFSFFFFNILQMITEICMLYDTVNDCDVYLAAGQVQGSVPVLIQQCQVSLGPVKKDG